MLLPSMAHQERRGTALGLIPGHRPRKHVGKQRSIPGFSAFFLLHSESRQETLVTGQTLVNPKFTRSFDYDCTNRVGSLRSVRAPSTSASLADRVRSARCFGSAALNFNPSKARTDTSGNVTRSWAAVLAAAQV